MEKDGKVGVYIALNTGGVLNERRQKHVGTIAPHIKRKNGNSRSNQNGDSCWWGKY